MKKVVYKNYFSFVIALVGLLLLFCGLSIDRKERDFFTNNNITSAQEIEAEDPEGYGSESEPYLISTPGNIRWIYENSGLASTSYFKQTMDIDLSPYYSMVLSTVYSYDGDDYSITLSGDQKYFIEYIPTNGELKNLTVYGGGQDSSIISIVSMCGGVIDNVNSCLTGCMYGFCHTLSTYYYDSWYGKENGVIKNCTNNSTPYSSDNTAGFVNLLDGGKIVDSKNHGRDSSGKGFDSGFAINTKNGAFFYNCINNAPVTRAGFVNYALNYDNNVSCAFDSCVNNGDSASSGYYETAGFVYQAAGCATFTDCQNNGNVSYGFCTGWEVSYQLQSLVYNFYNCQNYANVKTAFIGRGSYSSYGVGFYNCENYGETMVDGFVGDIGNAYVYMVDCINYASSGGAGFVGECGWGGFYNCVNKGERAVGGGICTTIRSSGAVTNLFYYIPELTTIFDGCINYASGVSSGIVDEYNPYDTYNYLEHSTTLQISNCINYGSASTAGILGTYSYCSYYCGLQINDCENYGVITCGGTYAGGILGSSQGFFTISNCKNFAAVTGGNAGGIVGFVSNSQTSVENLLSTISSCYVDMYFGTTDYLVNGVKCVDISGTNSFGLVIGYTYGDETFTRQTIANNFLKANLIASSHSTNFGVIYGVTSLTPRSYADDISAGFYICDNLAEVNYFTTETGAPAANNSIDFCNGGYWGAYANIFRRNGVEYKVYDEGHLGQGYFSYFSFCVYQEKTILKGFTHFAPILPAGVAATEEIVYNYL